MSAFVVSHDHIDALLTFAELRRMQSRLSYFINPASQTPLNWSEIGRVLLTENIRSVCARYPDCSADNTPGKIGETVEDYHYKTFQHFFSIQHADRCAWTIKACDCFDYQACETDDYDQTVAHRIIMAIRKEASRALPGYDAAPWEINRDRLPQPERKPARLFPEAIGGVR